MQDLKSWAVEARNVDKYMERSMIDHEYFFRDPARVVPDGPGLLVSPADGTITHIEELDEPDFLGGRALRISIFLSVFDVHLNRAPCAGTVPLNVTAAPPAPV